VRFSDVLDNAGHSHRQLPIAGKESAVAFDPNGLECGNKVAIAAIPTQTAFSSG
jgi:hypothetical protein